MKNRYILYIVALVALLSCEKELDISVLNGKGGALTISAIAVPDSAFNISLTRVYDIDKVPVKVMKTFLLLALWNMFLVAMNLTLRIVT